MRFVQRSLMGLFLLAMTLGLLALAAGSVRQTVEARLERQSKPVAARERVFSVNVGLAERITVEPVLSTFGEIRSRRTLDLRAPVSGTVIHLSANFVEGGPVSRGDLLLRLDPADAETALALTETQGNEAEAELREAEAALLLAHDELAAAEAQADLRAAALERQKNLVSRGVGTEAAVETAALARSSAVQAALGKRQSLAQAEARVNRARTALDRHAINLADARRRLENTEIYAEFDGVLSGVTLVEGGLVGTNEKIGRLIDPAALEVAFRVSNTQFARLVEANGGVPRGKVRVELDILGEDVVADGTIERVSGEVGTGQTGRQMFALLPAAAAATFRPGDFVTVEVREPPLEGVAVLPSTAVDAAANVLLIGENERLEELAVTVLRRQGDTVIVRAQGLYGREYVEARSPLLGAGIRVKPVRKDGAEAPAQPEMIALSPERRARLVAFIEANQNIPKDAKDRILTRLQQDNVPVEMVERIESRMGG